MPYFFRKDDDKYCVYKGTPKEPEERLKCYDSSEEAQKYVAALMANVADADKGAGGVDQCECPECGATAKHEAGTPCRKTKCPKCGAMMEAKVSDKSLATTPSSPFTIKRQSDGSYRWWSVSSVAIEDKEGETLSEKAYDDAIRYATEALQYGDLDLVHIKGTSIGECDEMVRLGKLLIESGIIPDVPRARGVIKAVESDPDYWGVSLKFTYDPELFDTETRTYQGGVRIINRTVLPKWMAASYGTAIALEGGNMKMDKDAIDALKALGISEDEIKMLSEQEKSVDPPNVVEKAEDEPEPEETVEEEVPAGIKKWLTDLLTRVQKPVEQAEKAEAVEAEVAPEPLPAIEIDYDEITKRAATPIMEAVLKSLNASLEPLNPFLEAVVAAQNGLVEQNKALDERIKALEGPIEDEVTKRLAELPPVVKVGATTVEFSQAPQIVSETVPEQPATPQAAFMKMVETSVENAVGRRLDEAKIEV